MLTFATFVARAPETALAQSQAFNGVKKATPLDRFMIVVKCAF
jgi:hypothetical protein